MSGAAGLAAARRRRGNAQPAPQRMNNQQPPPVPQQQQQVPVAPQGGPQTPMTILHQHHIKLEEHDKVFDEINEKINVIQESHVSNLPKNMEMNTPSMEQMKGTMIETLENDLQNGLRGDQLKLAMLTSTMNAQQNYILELNTTLLGVVKQMTKLLGMKEKEMSTAFQTPQLSSVLPTTERNMETYLDPEAASFNTRCDYNHNKIDNGVSNELTTEYYASDPPEPYDNVNTPTFGYADTGITPTLESIANDQTDVDMEKDTRNIMDDDNTMTVVDDDNTMTVVDDDNTMTVVDDKSINEEDPVRDLSVE